MTAGPDEPRRLILLGSTGSIGTAVIEVVEHLARHGVRFEIVGLAAGANASLLAEQMRRTGARAAAIASAGCAGALPGSGRVFAGPDGARELVECIARPGDLVVGAIVGAVGVPATLAAIERGCDVALANKETLVAAGALVMALARERGVTILPIDSEHSAIFQCLRGGRSVDDVARVVLTASGGPFRTWSAEALDAVTVAEALDHPTWTMGRKVTIDSATLMNKALEVIEAHWLFGLPARRIEAVIHPQSIVHGLIEFVDGSVLAQLGPPDMRTPIQYALTWPERAPGCSERIDWRALGDLSFEPVDDERFPAIGLARRVIETGGTLGAVLNAANEVAVDAFLDGRIGFRRVSELVREAIENADPGPVGSIEDVLAADRATRDAVAGWIPSAAGAAAERR